MSFPWSHMDTGCTGLQPCVATSCDFNYPLKFPSLNAITLEWIWASKERIFRKMQSAHSKVQLAFSGLVPTSGPITLTSTCLHACRVHYDVTTEHEGTRAVFKNVSHNHGEWSSSEAEHSQGRPISYINLILAFNLPSMQHFALQCIKEELIFQFHFVDLFWLRTIPIPWCEALVGSLCLTSERAWSDAMFTTLLPWSHTLKIHSLSRLSNFHQYTWSNLTWHGDLQSQ